MAASPSERVLRQVHQLFHFGAAGAMSDSQLLDRFVSRRDEAAESAFEALVIRHGPMVLRVCRNLLHNSHDAEDAFQAVFLVLANRAGSIRRSKSVASWLFGVAHRVASRVKRGAARRQALNQIVAERTSVSDLQAENDPDWEILHDEINGLAERLRAPIILCYLQGLTYDAAAHQLGVSEVAIRGRLARARSRLRLRLIRRGVTVPAALLVVYAAGPAEASIPVTLIHSTVRIALGFTAGNTAAVLARGVLNSMLLNQLKVATALLCLGIGGSYWTWHAFATTGDENPRRNPDPVVATAPASVPKSETTQPVPSYGLTGSVRLEGTGEPVAGATVEVMIGDSGKGHFGATRTARSGADGRFAVKLPPGCARAWTLKAPVGYWIPDNIKNIEEFVVSSGEPFRHKDYVVRRGTVWDFVLSGVADARPRRTSVMAFDQADQTKVFSSEIDDSGGARLTLPTEGGTVTAHVGAEVEVAEWVQLTIEWGAGFRPGAVQSVIKLGNSPIRYRLVDDNGRMATVTGPEKGQAEPRLDGNKLVFQVTLPVTDPKASGDVVGKVIDASGEPIAGAQVQVVWVSEQGSGMAGGDRYRAITDAQGSYLLRAMPRGQLTKFHLAVTREGYAGVDTRPVAFDPPADGKPQVADPVTLVSGFSLTGVVVDPDGKPLAGVWVQPQGSYANRSQFTRTDDAGRFTVRDLPEGRVSFNFRYGKLAEFGAYFAGKGSDPVKVTLRRMPDPAQMKSQTELAKPAGPEPPAVGTLAPEWKMRDWSDGLSHSLADFRGKVVFLDFWGIWCSPCVNGLQSLERLKQKYEPRGAIFLSIHTPGEQIGNIRRFLEFKKTTLISALDEDAGRDDESHNGVTADRYGVRGYPTIVMIDRRGNVAFHSGIGTKEGVAAMKALGKEMGIEEAMMTEADFHRLWEAFFGREIDRILNRP